MEQHVSAYLEAIIRFTVLALRDNNVSSGCWDLIIMLYKVYMREDCVQEGATYQLHARTSPALSA